MSTTFIESIDNTHNPTVTITGGPRFKGNKEVSKLIAWKPWFNNRKTLHSKEHTSYTGTLRMRTAILTAYWWPWKAVSSLLGLNSIV